MAEFTEEEKKRLIQVCDVLLGVNGKHSLIEEVSKNSKAIVKIWILLAVLTASTGGGAFAILQTVLGG